MTFTYIGGLPPAGVRTTNFTPGMIALGGSDDPDEEGVQIVLENYYSGTYQDPDGIKNLQNRLEIDVVNAEGQRQTISVKVSKGDLLNMARVFLTAALDRKNW